MSRYWTDSFNLEPFAVFGDGVIVKDFFGALEGLSEFQGFFAVELVDFGRCTVLAT